jgi:hypothetical protein
MPHPAPLNVALDKAKRFLATDDLLSIDARITSLIRQANKALKERKYSECQGILLALQTAYPSQGIQPNMQHQDWQKVKDADKTTLAETLQKIEQIDLQAATPEKAKPKERRKGFLGKLFGFVNPSGLATIQDAQQDLLDRAYEEELEDAGFSPNKPRVVTREYEHVSYADIQKMRAECFQMPGFNEARVSPNFVETNCNMVSQGYIFNFDNMTSWINVNRRGAPEHKQSDTFGWKFHIGIDEEPENLRKGLDIVCQVLMKHQVTAFKMTPPGSTLNREYSMQAGKQATIYYELDKNKDWKMILEEVDEQLRLANIKPAPRMAEPEKRMGASPYIGYRNDKGQDNHYVEAAGEKSYNPAGREDPFLNFFTEKSKPRM